MKGSPAAGAPRIVLAAAHPGDGPEAVPLGIACIASALKAAFPGGIAVFLAESLVADGAAPLLRKIKANDPRGVGFSLYCWNRALMVEAAEGLRAESPEIFLFCGGPEATARPGGLSRSQGGPFDEVIPGEAEAETLRVLGERFPEIQARPEAAAFGDASPWLDGTLRPSADKGLVWELSRGCPYGCAFCYEGAAGADGKKRVRHIPQERILRELRLFIEAKVPYVFVLDSTFNGDKKRAIRILDMISEESLRGKAADTQWHFEVRAELLDREQARRFARLGASLQIGLQTADPRTAALLGRDFDKGLFRSRISLLNRQGVNFGLDLIYGLPGDSLAGYRRSLDFALSLYPNNLDLFRLAVLPGTALWDRAAELGLQADPEPPYEVFSAPGFSAPDLVRAEKLSEAADFFYNRGRAVAWFNQLLYPLRAKASAFLGGFADHLEERGLSSPQTAAADSTLIEKTQLSYLAACYRRAKKDALLPAVQDLVRFHGAWGRALAEGRPTDIDFHYPPGGLFSGAAVDLEAFAALSKPRPTRARMIPGKSGPELLL
jgi:radical SAM superfamily enzyme YgiQ (UPF0313 family)